LSCRAAGTPKGKATIFDNTSRSGGSTTKMGRYGILIPKKGTCNCQNINYKNNVHQPLVKEECVD
jgi:hypothetical protein